MRRKIEGVNSHNCSVCIVYSYSNVCLHYYIASANPNGFANVLT